MKKILKISFKVFKILLVVLVVLFIAVYAYVNINKAAIIKQVTDVFGKKINGKVSIGDVELSLFGQFPKISVLLSNVSVTDSMFSDHKHAFFQASSVFARISVINLIRKKPPLNGLTIRKGEVYLYTDTSGYSNTYLMERKKNGPSTPGKKQENELQVVILEEVSIIMDDRKKQKLHDYFVKDMKIKLDENDNAFLFGLKADIVIRSMAFNLARGSYLKDQEFEGKFGLVFDKKLNQLQFDSIDIELSGQPFNLTGRFDLKNEEPQFSLRAHTRKLYYPKGRAMLTPKLDSTLSIVQFDKPLDVDVNINGPLKGGEPWIYVNWTAKGTQLKTPFLDFEKASFTGFFNNQVKEEAARHDSNSVINVDNFKAEWRGMPLESGNIEIANLKHPLLTCDLVSKFPLSKLNELIGSSYVQLKSGDGSIDIRYKGPIERNSNTSSLVNGTVSFTNGELLYAPREVTMKNVNGELEFRNSDVFVKNLSCQVFENKILMEGHSDNLLMLINTAPGKATIDWNISTPNLDLGDFRFLLKPEKKMKPVTRGKDQIVSATSKIDELLAKAVLHVNLDADRLVYKNFQATSVNAAVTLLANKYVLNNVSMSHGGGTMKLKGFLLNQQRNYLSASLSASMENADVAEVLKSFDNFGQDAILSENLKGKLTANVDASMGLDEQGKVYPESITSNVDFSLKEGALVNFEPLKKIQKIIFKKRDFDNIRFAELKDRLEISNREIKINRMEIQSSVLSLYVEGLYSMRGNTDISVQVPLSNLKKRRADYNPENLGTDKKAKSIYLRGRPGSDGNVSFKLDLFNRYKKEKNGAGTVDTIPPE